MIIQSNPDQEIRNRTLSKFGEVSIKINARYTLTPEY